MLLGYKYQTGNQTRGALAVTVVLSVLALVLTSGEAVQKLNEPARQCIQASSKTTDYSLGNPRPGSQKHLCQAPLQPGMTGA